MGRLEGKTAIITGSTKGIGYGIAKRYAEEGANVVVVSRRQDDCDRVAAELAQLGVRTLGCAADVTNLEAIRAMVDKATATFGKIDILVNNAGGAITKKAEDLTEQDWDRVVDLDLKAVFFCAQAVGLKMIAQQSGKIINMASILGFFGEKQVLPYGVAKAGVILMTKTLALEWARYNIQVNALCPGYVVTPMNEADLADEKIYNHIVKNVPMRRIGQVEDMTGFCVYLASDESSYVTGQALCIDGGRTAGG